MIIVDTGLFVALLSNRDRYHRSAQRVLASTSEPLITTYPVITEACHIIRRRVSPTAEQIFLENLVNKASDIFHLQDSHLKRITVLMKKYSDLPMDFADASLVVLAEHLQDGRILTVDQRDFSVYRWNDTQPFQNLLLPN